MKPGTAFGDYRIMGCVARGGMADIHAGILARTHGFCRRVAIKCLDPSRATNPQYLAMFLEEARLAARLSHPNLVQTYDFVEENGAYGIVMEYLDGADLGTIIRVCHRRQQWIPVEIVAHVVACVADGLAYLHGLTDENGAPLEVVHRDVSPENIVITRNGEVRLIDLGIVKHRARTVKTEAGALKGKIHYLSPEQATAGALDGRSDIFSLGSVTHELLTLRSCFGQDRPLRTMQAIIEAARTPLREIRPQIPDLVVRILDRMLAVDPKERYPDAASIARDLRVFLLDNLAPTAEDVSRWLAGVPLKLPEPPPRLSTPSATPVRRPPSRRTDEAPTLLMAASELTPSGSRAGQPSLSPVSASRSRRIALTAIVAFWILILGGTAAILAGAHPARKNEAPMGSPALEAGANPAVTNYAPMGSPANLVPAHKSAPPATKNDVLVGSPVPHPLDGERSFEGTAEVATAEVATAEVATAEVATPATRRIEPPAREHDEVPRVEPPSWPKQEMVAERRGSHGPAVSWHRRPDHSRSAVKPRRQAGSSRSAINQSRSAESASVARDPRPAPRPTPSPLDEPEPELTHSWFGSDRRPITSARRPVTPVRASPSLSEVPTSRARAPVIPARKSARWARNSAPSPASSVGLIAINANPWAVVYMDGKEVGTTPIPPFATSIGSHHIRLVNDSLDVAHDLEAQVGPGKTTRLRIDLRP